MRNEISGCSVELQKKANGLSQRDEERNGEDLFKNGGDGKAEKEFGGHLTVLVANQLQGSESCLKSFCDPSPFMHQTNPWNRRESGTAPAARTGRIATIWYAPVLANIRLHRMRRQRMYSDNDILYAVAYGS